MTLGIAIETHITDNYISKQFMCMHASMHMGVFYGWLLNAMLCVLIISHTLTKTHTHAHTHTAQHLPSSWSRQPSKTLGCLCTNQKYTWRGIVPCRWGSPGWWCGHPRSHPFMWHGQQLHTRLHLNNVMWVHQVSCSTATPGCEVPPGSSPTVL